MAEEKKVATGEVGQATTDAEKAAAAKVKKASKGSKKTKENKPGIFSRIKDFFVGFKGETKKVVWPDAKTVLKSTGVVILVVAIVALAVLGIDSLLAFVVKSLQNVATGEVVTEATTAVTTTTTTAANSGIISSFSSILG